MIDIQLGVDFLKPFVFALQFLKPTLGIVLFRSVVFLPLIEGSGTDVDYN